MAERIASTHAHVLDRAEPCGRDAEARKLLGEIVQPYRLDAVEARVTASIGVSIYPDDASDALALMKHADTAMYKAKEAGRNNFQFYSPEMNAVIAQRLEMQSALQFAVEQEQFSLLYQPKMDLATGCISGMEDGSGARKPWFSIVLSCLCSGYWPW